MGPAPRLSRRVLILGASLAAVLAAFFILLLTVWKGRVEGLSLPYNRVRPQLTALHAKVNERLLEMEGEAKHLAEDKKLGEVLLKGRQRQEKTEKRGKSWRKGPNGPVPEGALLTRATSDETIYLLDRDGRILDRQPETATAPRRLLEKGYGADAASGRIYFALPLSADQTWQGTLLLSYPFEKLVSGPETAALLGDLARAPSLTPSGHGVFDLGLQPVRDEALLELDEKLAAVKGEGRRIYLPKIGRAFVYASTGPWPSRLGILYGDNQLGVPPMAIVLLLALVLAAAGLFTWLYLSLRGASRRRAEALKPTRLREAAAPPSAPVLPEALRTVDVNPHESDVAPAPLEDAFPEPSTPEPVEEVAALPEELLDAAEAPAPESSEIPSIQEPAEDDPLTEASTEIDEGSSEDDRIDAGAGEAEINLDDGAELAATEAEGATVDLAEGDGEDGPAAGVLDFADETTDPAADAPDAYAVELDADAPGPAEADDESVVVAADELDLGDLETAVDQGEEAILASMDVPEAEAADEGDAGDDGALPEVPDEVFAQAKAADPRVSKLISEVETPADAEPRPLRRLADAARSVTALGASLDLHAVTEALPESRFYDLAILRPAGGAWAVAEAAGFDAGDRAVPLHADHPLFQQVLAKGRTLHLKDRPSESKWLAAWVPADVLARARQVTLTPLRGDDGSVGALLLLASPERPD